MCSYNGGHVLNTVIILIVVQALGVICIQWPRWMPAWGNNCVLDTSSSNLRGLSSARRCAATMLKRLEVEVEVGNGREGCGAVARWQG